jgi:hypothetical protein
VLPKSLLGPAGGDARRDLRGPSCGRMACRWSPVDRFLAYVQVLPRSPNMVAAYAYDLRAFVRFPA